MNKALKIAIVDEVCDSQNHESQNLTQHRHRLNVLGLCAGYWICYINNYLVVVELFCVDEINTLFGGSRFPWLMSMAAIYLRRENDGFKVLKHRFVDVTYFSDWSSLLKSIY